MEARTGEHKGVIAAMNIVPLIDILLVLLIIFMVISPVETVGLSAQLPQPSTNESAAPQPGTVVVQVVSHDEVFINQDAVSWQKLGSRLAAVFSQRAEKVAFVKGGDAVEFADVARAIDIMRSAGIDRVGLISGNLAAAR
jgi:biopolymer transport protein TolR